MPIQRKRKRVGTLGVRKDAILPTGPSVEEQAARYLLGTAIVPLEVLKCTEKNRARNERSITKLLEGFRRGGVAWTSHHNYMVVECEKEAFNTMRDELARRRNGGCGPEGVLDFQDWVKINGNKAVVLVNGRHRRDTSMEYNNLVGCQEGEVGAVRRRISSWTCVVYNQGETGCTNRGERLVARNEWLTGQKRCQRSYGRSYG